MRYYTEVQGLSVAQALYESDRVAEDEAEFFEQCRLEPRNAYEYEIHGVTLDYPDPNCRLLTLTHGARGWKRPNCWFNP
jgi:hypothetical protein